MKADLSKIYREFVEKGKQLPPEDLWENISNQLDIEDSWIEISNRLDVVQVWNNVSHELDAGIVAAQKSSFINTWYGKSLLTILSGTVLVLLSLFIGNRLNLPDTQIALNPESQVQVNEDANKKSDSPKELATLETISKNEIKSETNENLLGLDETINPVLKPEKVSVKEIIRQSDNDILTGDIVDSQSLVSPPPSDKKPGNLPPQVLETGSLQSVALVYNEVENSRFDESSRSSAVYEEVRLNPILPMNNQDIKLGNHRNELEQALKEGSSVIALSEKMNGQMTYPRIWRLGFTINGSNNWLMNQETFSGFDASELNTTILDFSTHWELVADIPLYRKWWIRTTAFGQNPTGQRYKTYYEGTYSSKDIELKYAGINLLAKHKSFASWLGTQRVSFNTSFGFYFNVLWSAEETIGTASMDVPDQYKTTDYGLVFGHEIEFQAWDRISLAPGFKLNWGIPNIYEGDDKIPSSFKTTHNGSIELTFGVYYLIVR